MARSSPPGEGRGQVRRRAEGRPRHVRPSRHRGPDPVTIRRHHDGQAVQARIRRHHDPPCGHRAAIGPGNGRHRCRAHRRRRRDVDAAKSLFRHYAGDEVLEETAYGVVLNGRRRRPDLRQRPSRRRGAELPLQLRHHLAHQGAARGPQPGALERRSDRLYRPCEGDRPGRLVGDGRQPLAEDLSLFESGPGTTRCSWSMSASTPASVLNATGRVIFLTPDELDAARDFVDRARTMATESSSCRRTSAQSSAGLVDVTGAPIVDLERVQACSGTRASRSRSSTRPSSRWQERAVFDRRTRSSPCRRPPGDGQGGLDLEDDASRRDRLAEAAGVWEPKERGSSSSATSYARSRAYAGRSSTRWSMRPPARGTSAPISRKR